MIVLWAALASAAEILVTVTPVGGAALPPMPVLQIEEDWVVSAQQTVRVQPRPLVLRRHADVHAADWLRWFRGNVALGVTIAVYEPDPGTPGATRVGETLTLTGARVLTWGHEVQADVGPVESVGLASLKWVRCALSYPGPVETCATFDVDTGVQ